MENTSIPDLLEALKHPDEATRQEATDELWRVWFQQKGIHGTRQLMKSQTLLQAGEFEEAEALLSSLIRDQPDFAEAWNRRAVLYFTQQRYWDAIADCQRVIELVPYHFGALHGLGLCHAALGNYSPAIQAFRQALEVQPYSLINQRLILECTAKLS
jgi:tetratricopeptide (TPR) repeat protein